MVATLGCRMHYAVSGCRRSNARMVTIMWNRRKRRLHSIPRIIVTALWLLALPVCGITQETAVAGQRTFAAYYESWLARATGASDEELAARVPASVTIINLAFMRPDARYLGNVDLSGTGFEFQYGGRVLKDSIGKLKQARPETKVLASVGGERYTNWASLNVTAIARFVYEFGLDGVDVDFEPPAPGCKESGGRVLCEVDGLLSHVINQLREALPRPAIIALTSVSTGAFGEGAWQRALPRGGPYYGMMLGLLRNPVGRDQIDLVSIMAYNAGSRYDPLVSYEAYRNYYRGPILIGFTPPPESWGDHAYTDQEVKAVLRAGLSRGAAGAMLFSLRRMPMVDGITPMVNVIATALSSD
jgi:chitinase